MIWIHIAHFALSRPFPALMLVFSLHMGLKIDIVIVSFLWKLLPSGSYIDYIVKLSVS